VTKRHHPLCAQGGKLRLGQGWMRIGVLIALGCVAARVSGQNCTASNPQLAVSDLETLLATCSSPADFQVMNYKMRGKYGDNVILGQASVAGNLAIPVLRRFASLPRHNECTSTGLDAAARMALAKLGDENAYAAIKQQWAHPTRNAMYPAGIDFIGDDWALQTLVEFLIQHANDPRMIVQHGPADGPIDVRSVRLAQIEEIARRHVVPDLPDADYSPSGVAEWKAWLGKHRGQHLSTPVFESVSDPYLQCLARRVEWGHPDAILDIATFGGPSAEAILKRFPAPRSGEVMGARELFPDILLYENGRRPSPDSEIQGNLQAALLRFGDQRAAFQVATELNSFASFSGYFPFEAIRKLRFAGGKTAVGVLVDGLGSANRISQDAQKDFDSCLARVTQVNQPSNEQKESAQRECARFLYWAERRTSLILNALAEMVKNPPLPADAPPTAESSQKWKDWWIKNRDTAVFTVPPRASYDWH
jgi:hypothetical protein